MASDPAQLTPESPAHTAHLQLRTVVASLRAGVLLEDGERRIAAVNPEFCRIFGIPAPPEALVGTDCSGAADQSKHLFKDPAAFAAGIERILEQGEAVSGELLELADGHVVERDYHPVAEDGRRVGHFWQYADVTERVRSNRALESSDLAATKLLEIAARREGLLDRLPGFLSAGMRLLGLDAGLITRRVPDGLEVISSAGATGLQPGDLLPAGQSLCWETTVTGETIALADLRETEWADRLPAVAAGTGSYVGVPILAGRETIGSLAFFDPRRLDEPFGDRELRLLQLMAEWIGAETERRDAIAALEASERDAALARDDAIKANKTKSEFIATTSHELRTPLYGVIGSIDLLLATELGQEQRELIGVMRDSSENLTRIIDDILDVARVEAGRLELEREPFDIVDVVESAVGAGASVARDHGIALASYIDPAIPAGLVGDAGRLRQVIANLVANAVDFTPRGDVVVRARLDAFESHAAKVRIEVADTGVGISPEELPRLFEPFHQAKEDGRPGRSGAGLGLSICRHLATAMGGEIKVESSSGVGTTFSFTVELPFEGTISARPLELAGRRIAVSGSHRNAVAAIAETLAGLGAETVVLEESGADPDDATAEPPELVLAEESADPAVPLGGPVRVIKVGWSPDADVHWPPRRQLLLEVTGARSAPPGGQAELPRLEGHVLVVDDVETNREIICRQLDRLGLGYDAVTGGEAAVEAVRSGNYSIVLMDCRMPGLDGFGATRAIRDAERGGSRLPIVAMTANATSRDRERCFAAGMDDFLAKPTRMAQAAQVIGRWLDSERIAAAPDPGAVESDPAAGPDQIDAIASGVMRLERELGGAEAANEIVALYLEEAPRRERAIVDAALAGDSEALAAAAHALKGSIALFGAAGIAAVADRIERAARQGTISPPAQIAEIQQRLRQLGELLERRLLEG